MGRGGGWVGTLMYCTAVRYEVGYCGSRNADAFDESESMNEFYCC